MTSLLPEPRPVTNSAAWADKCRRALRESVDRKRERELAYAAARAAAEPKAPPPDEEPVVEWATEPEAEVVSS